MTGLVIRRATPDELPVVSGLLARAASWMHRNGWDAWKPEGFPDWRLTPGLAEGTVWLVGDTGRADAEAVATLALDRNPEQEFTCEEATRAGVGELLPDARIMHRLAVCPDRIGQGIGALLLDWAADRTHREGGRWLLANAARRATPLQDWYARHGFRHLVTVTSTRTPEGLPRKSGSLWVREAGPAELGDRLTEQD